MKKIKKSLVIAIALLLSIFNIRVAFGESPFYNVTGIYLKNDTVNYGDRIYVDYMGQTNDSTKVVGYFQSSSDNKVSLNMKDVNTRNPYFEMSRYMEIGATYTMTGVTVTDDRDSITYSMVQIGDNYMNPLGKNLVTITNPTIQLTNLALVGDSSVKPDGKLTLAMSTNSNEPISYPSFILRNKAFPTNTTIVYGNKDNNSGYYVLDLSRKSNDLEDGDYYISDVFVSNGSASAHFSSYSTGSSVIPLSFRVDVTINSGSNSNIEYKTDLLKSIALQKEEAELNEKIYVSLETEQKISSAMLIFTNENESMSVNLKDLNSNEPYFVVPLTTSAGIYELDYAILKDEDSNKIQYRKGEDNYGIKHFDFNSTLTVVDKISSSETLELDNSKINSAIVEKIKNLDSNITIGINADDDSIIAEEIFEAIKGKNINIIIKCGDFEWAFNGLDINEPKQINVNVDAYSANNSNLSEMVEEGLVLDFAANGELPGKCLIKVYNSAPVISLLKKSAANVYYYNETENKFEIIELETNYQNEGYYEFYISHNSKYVMTNTAIKNEHILGASGSTENDNMVKIIAIVASISVMMLIVLMMLIMKNKKSKKNLASVDASNSGMEMGVQPQQPVQDSTQTKDINNQDKNI